MHTQCHSQRTAREQGEKARKLHSTRRRRRRRQRGQRDRERERGRGREECESSRAAGSERLSFFGAKGMWRWRRTSSNAAQHKEASRGWEGDGDGDAGRACVGQRLRAAEGRKRRSKRIKATAKKKAQGGRAEWRQEGRKARRREGRRKNEMKEEGN